MHFTLLYILVGVILTALVDYKERKHGHPMEPLTLLVSILGWPYFLGYWLVDNLKKLKKG